MTKRNETKVEHKQKRDENQRKKLKCVRGLFADSNNSLISSDREPKQVHSRVTQQFINHFSGYFLRPCDELHLFKSWINSSNTTYGTKERINHHLRYSNRSINKFSDHLVVWFSLAVKPFNEPFLDHWLVARFERVDLFTKLRRRDKRNWELTVRESVKEIREGVSSTFVIYFGVRF